MHKDLLMHVYASVSSNRVPSNMSRSAELAVAAVSMWSEVLAT